MESFLSIEVGLGERSYNIQVAPGILTGIGTLVDELGLKGAATIITDTRVGPLYSERIMAGLAQRAVRCIEIPEGEPNKTLETVRSVYDEVLAMGRGRDSFIVALGGGVVGDLAGFVAATYLRGIPFIQIPTSLLAQVDSSVGGKVGVDLPQGKNLIGAFYQPKAVCIDPDVLTTLQRRHFVNGLAEIFKHGVIWHERFFSFLEETIDQLMELDRKVLVEVIGRSCRIKADVVEQDEKESGIRAILNYGHTIGHAVEASMAYEGWLHGEAIAAGMLAETRVAQKLGLANDETYSRQERLFSKAGLPTRLPKMDSETFREIIFRDKKKVANKLRFVLPLSIGKVEIFDDVPWNLIAETVQELSS